MKFLKLIGGITAELLFDSGASTELQNDEDVSILINDIVSICKKFAPQINDLETRYFFTDGSEWFIFKETDKLFASTRNFFDNFQQINDNTLKDLLPKIVESPSRNIIFKSRIFETFD